MSTNGNLIPPFIYNLKEQCDIDSEAKPQADWYLQPCVQQDHAVR